MKMNQSRGILLTCTLTCMSAAMMLPAAASAQAYPNKPIRFIVGFPPGGATEFIARLVGQKLTLSMGQQVIVDNRPGAAGNLGIELAARAAPDGYTLLLVAPNITISPSLYKKLA